MNDQIQDGAGQQWGNTFDLGVSFGKASLGTAHSEIFLSSPPLSTCLPSVEKVTQHTRSECWKMETVR
jgi:hypothetical protein